MAIDAQPNAEMQAEREQMADHVERLSAAFREERQAEEAARTARESGAEPAAPPKGKAQPKQQQTEPSVAEQVAERAARREAQRQADSERARRLDHLESVINSIGPEVEHSRAIRAAHARGDLDEVARLLGGKGWIDIQEHYVRTLSDPSYGRVIELERKLAEREELERRQSEHARAVATHQQQQVAIAQYKHRMSVEAKASSDPVLADFHDTPALVEALFAVRSAHYQETGFELPLEKCLDVRQPNGMTIREGLDSYESLADRYRKAKTRSASPAQEPKPKAKAPAQPKPKRDEEPEPAWRRSFEPSDEDRWLERAKKEWNRAAAEERRREGTR